MKTNTILESNDVSKFNTVPSKLDPKQLGRDELGELIQVEREWKDHEKPYQTLPSNILLAQSQVKLVKFKPNNAASKPYYLLT